MKLGLQLGYWGAQPPDNHAELVAAAEDAGFDAVFTAEAWGSDAYTPLAWWGSSTRRLRLGTSVVQLSARTPTACAMAALTLDHLSGGRHLLGLGVSGPQVVEGWYGQSFPKPLARTREYIDVVRQVLAREKPVTSDGPHYPLPLTGERSTGLGKPLKPITHPLRADIPIMLGAEDTNFHADVYRRMGYAEVVDDVTRLFRSNEKDKAATIIPDEVIDDAAIVGDVDYVRKQIKAWEAAGVTMMVVSGRNVEQVREVATLV